MIKIFICTFFLSFIALAESSEFVTAAPPLFESGIFVGSAVIPDYPASDQSRNRTIALPLIYYTGDIFRSEESDGTRFRIFNSKKIDFDLSFGGSFATDTDSNYARQGMPALDWTLEIGPRFLYYFFKEKTIGQVRLGIPVRTAVATNFTTWRSIGNLFSPTFQIDKYNFLFENLNFYFFTNLTYTDEGEADYFYQIDPQFQTPERSQFDAKGGFWGYDMSLAFKYTWNKKSVIIGSRYSDLSGSANSKSYLHRSSINWTHIIAFSWLFYESEIKGVH